MKRFILSVLTLLCLTAPAFAGIDETINDLTAPLAKLIGAIVFVKIPLFGAQLPIVVLWLVAGAVFFTFYMGFVNLRGFTHALKLVRGDYADPDSAGEVSHFQALATALSGTVGTGNIAGVALAVYLGGPAALFWMLMTAAVGMTTKFVEVTLSHKYREKSKDGTIAGGPMYYMKNADFQLFGFKLNFKWLKRE